MKTKIVLIKLIFLVSYPILFLFLRYKRYWMIDCSSKDDDTNEYLSGFYRYMINEHKYIKARCVNKKNTITHLLVTYVTTSFSECIISSKNALLISSDFIQENNKAIHISVDDENDVFILNKSVLIKQLFKKENYYSFFDDIIHLFIERIDSTKNKEPTFLIFTGDDYLRNKESTYGIDKAFEKGFIQQTSVISNGSYNLLKTLNQNIPYVMHINILEGNGKTVKRLFNVNDNSSISYKLIKTSSFFILKNKYRKLIKDEIEWQIKQYNELGAPTIAFDSHGHIHNRLPILKTIIPICIKHGFKVARIPMNTNKEHQLFNIIYKRHVTNILRKYFKTTDYFCSCYELIHLNLNDYEGKIIEVMTHPYLVKNNELVNRRDISFKSLKLFLSKFNVRLIDYSTIIE